MKKSIFILSVATLLAMGCSKDSNFVEQNSNFDPNEIRIEAEMGGTRATLTNFEAGDQMSLYVVEYTGDEIAEVQPLGNYINNEKMTYNGREWKSDRPLYWSKTHCDFYGFYPYQPSGSLKDVYFEVATDQSQPSANGVLGGYEASDIMWAKTEKIKPPYTTYTDDDGTVCTPPIAEDHYYPVKMQFNHMMTRVVVDIVRGTKYEGELPKDISVHIYNTATTAIVDWTIGSLKAYPQGGRKTINMRKVDIDTFDAIVVPQFIERRTPLIEITMGGIAYLLETSMSFRPGKQHTITVTLNTSPDQEKIEIELDGEVEDWE